jgi:branched-chain amino acid transport system ATP-binding protein
MLEFHQITARYGNIEALRNVSVSIRKGEIISLIGANGAGKSTTLNVMSGIVSAQSGEVVFEGRVLNGKRASAIMREGIVQVPEGRLVFRDLTVHENLEVGAYTLPRSRFAHCKGFVFDLFPKLAERQQQPAGLLSGGEQQMLAIARALIVEPKLLLLDEPSMGLAPLVTASIFTVLRKLCDDTGLTLLLVEQNASAALKIADRAYVLTNGRITKTGNTVELLKDSGIQEHFLGKRRYEKQT